MIVQRWKNRDLALSRGARYLFIMFAISLVAAFALVYFEPPQTVEVLSDFFHPERGSHIITPLTTIEKAALWITLFGGVAFISGLILLLRSLYRPRTSATSII